MTVDHQGFLQDRLGRSHAEQVWSVALVCGLNAFALVQGKLLVPALGLGRLRLGLGLTCLLALLFLWSRAFVYRHYDRLLRALLESGPQGRDFRVQGFRRVARGLLGWSGVALYTLVLLGSTWAALAGVGRP